METRCTLGFTGTVWIGKVVKTVRYPGKGAVLYRVAEKGDHKFDKLQYVYLGFRGLFKQGNYY